MLTILSSNIWLTGTYDNDVRILRFAAQKHEELVSRLQEELGPDSGWSTVIQFHPLTKAMVSHGKGSNVLGLERRMQAGAGNIQVAMVGTNSSEHDAKAYPLMLEYQQSIDDYATSLSANWGWRYLNYADRRTQDAITSLGNEAIAKLKAASAKYDPDGVFQHLRKSGFKIPM